ILEAFRPIIDIWDKSERERRYITRLKGFGDALEENAQTVREAFATSDAALRLYALKHIARYLKDFEPFAAELVGALTGPVKKQRQTVVSMHIERYTIVRDLLFEKATNGSLDEKINAVDFLATAYGAGAVALLEKLEDSAQDQI